MGDGVLVSIAARPEPITIDTATTAAIVVDMQNDFCSEGGMLDRAGVDVTRTRGMIEPTARTLACLRRAGIGVVYLKLGFRPDLSDFAPIEAPLYIERLPIAVGTPVEAPGGRRGRILIRDTWNTEIVDELAPRPEDAVVYETRLSGFYETELESVLGSRGVKSLIFAGVSIGVFVESTLRDAMYRGYFCLLVADCAAEPFGDDLGQTDDGSLPIVESLFGWVTTSSEIVRSLGSTGP